MTIQQLSQSNRLTNTMAYISVFFFTFFILKWYTLQWGWTGTHSPIRRPSKACNPTHWDRWTSEPRRYSPISRPTQVTRWLWTVHGCVACCSLAFVFCCMMSSEHRRRKKLASLQAGGAWSGKVGRVLGYRGPSQSSTHEGPRFTSLIIMGIKM